MNDFTKEELKNLLYYTAHYMSCKWTDNESLALEKKIQSMIDNYCDHDCNCELRRQMMQIDLCEKCRRFKFVFAHHEEVDIYDGQ